MSGFYECFVCVCTEILGETRQGGSTLRKTVTITESAGFESDSVLSVYSCQTRCIYLRFLPMKDMSPLTAPELHAQVCN